MSNPRKEYLQKLAAAIDTARAIADEFPQKDGSGGGFSLDRHRIFGYGNTSDLLSDLARHIQDEADNIRDAA